MMLLARLNVDVATEDSPPLEGAAATTPAPAAGIAASLIRKGARCDRTPVCTFGRAKDWPTASIARSSVKEDLCIVV